MEHLNKTTIDGADVYLDALFKVCPTCFTEVRDDNGNVKNVVDWIKLRSFLGSYVEENSPEVYDFTWVGKRAAQREAAAPISKTLRPCPEESVDWDKTKNLYIEGDNLEVLKLLQNSYMGKVKMIYIDPPYNTGNDFVYSDERSLSEEDYNTSISDEVGRRFIKNTYSNGAFHSDWCSMLYSRLLVARTLLSDDGVIFISIGDTECGNIYKLCNEIYGESNFIAKITIVTGANQAGEGVLIQKNVEYCFAYAKNIEQVTINRIDKTEESYRNLNDAPTPLETRPDMGYTIYYNPNTSEMIPIIDYNKEDICLNDEKYVYHDNKELVSRGFIPIRPGKRNGKLHRWRWGIDTFKERQNEINMFKSKNGFTPKFLQSGYNPPKNIQNFTVGTSDLKKLFGEQVPFDYSKGVAFMKYLVNIGSNKESIILDFFSGSATTAHAIMQQNSEDGGSRKFIMVQLTEETSADSNARELGYNTIPEIAKRRIVLAGNNIKEEMGLSSDKLDTGFRVFKCDYSNFKDVNISPDEYSQEGLDAYLDNIKEDRSDLDLLFDCMLRWGVELSLPISKKKIGDCTIHNVNDGDLVACFNGIITEEIISAIAEMNPLRVVFRDNSFEEASQKMNLFELFKQKCDWSDQEVMNNVKVI